MRRKTTALVYVLSPSLLGFAQENISPRSVFMSPAGSRIEYKEGREVKEETTRAKVARKQYLGMEVQVLVPSGMGLRPVDHKSHTFRTGDRFKVQVFYNSPRVVEFYNENPEGKITYLGRWVIEQAFSGTVLPEDGWFSFRNKKGRDKLITYFYPCQPHDKKVVEEIYTAHSRDIGVVKDNGLSKIDIDENVYASLSMCNFSESGRIREDYLSASRNIVYMEEKTTHKTYYFISIEDYKANNKPVIAVLEFIHR